VPFCGERGVSGRGRPRQGEALQLAQCVVGQINALAGRRTHGPCVPTAYEGVFVARVALADAGNGHDKSRPY
jgi:hypothetical protein